MPRRSSGAPNALKPFVGDSGQAIAAITPIGGGVSSPYDLIVTSAQLSFGTDFIDATGEMSGNLTGDDVDDLNLLSLRRGVGQASISGFAKATAAIGLASLENESNNIVNVIFLIGVGQNSTASAGEDRKVKFRMAVERCNINFDVDQPFVGVSLSGRTTSSFGGNTHPVTEAT
tara:strand:+ start:9280 stop:9801 length:522 start_codon:yes stop_codon:yes gene_type:complete